MFKHAEFKITGRDEITVTGYAAAWGGRDAVGDYFDPERTDFWMEFLPEKLPVLWEHGQDPSLGKSILGHIEKSDIVPDDFGLRVTAKLRAAGDHMRAIIEMLKAGQLGFSSGSVGHLVQRARDGLLQSWPLAELSLTQTPCEARLAPVHIIGQLGKSTLFGPQLCYLAECKSLGEVMERISEREALEREIEALELSYEIDQMERAIR